MRSSTLRASCVLLIAACSHAAPVETTAAHETAPPAAVTAETSGGEPTESPAEAPRTIAAVHAPHHHHEAACGEVTVTFPSGSYVLDPAAEQRLDAYAACITSERARVVYVSGTTDPSGSEADNMVLARARGRAVADYLHGVGIHTDFEIHATGEAGALPTRQVWPLERAATVSDVRPN